ncbi:maltokinase N-terminal cap-like domain-containing protein, partial [Streptomyces boluensis]
MALIHQTTLKPTKLELLTDWLPTRPWFAGEAARVPELAKVGGFRLDDPEGEVGIEFMVVTDTSGEHPVTYHVPLSYRGAPLDGAEDGLITTLEHGVLGTRWVYDGSRDPVVLAQVLALLQGRTEAQAQSETDTPDPSVVAHCDGPVLGTGVGVGVGVGVASLSASDTADGTVIAVRTAAGPGGPAGVELWISRVLVPLSLI